MSVHVNLINRLVNHRAEIKAAGAVGDDFFAFLKNWLVSHICGIDTKYAAVAASA